MFSNESAQGWLLERDDQTPTPHDVGGVLEREFGRDPSSAKAHGEFCTFETLIERFVIRDRAVLRLAEIIHDIDQEDDKFSSNRRIRRCANFERLGQRGRQRRRNPAERLSMLRGSPCAAQANMKTTAWSNTARVPPSLIRNSRAIKQGLLLVI